MSEEKFFSHPIQMRDRNVQEVVTIHPKNFPFRKFHWNIHVEYYRQMSNGIMKKLPQDVTSCIIFRLAVKSLLWYKCISKTWCTLLESSYFIILHVKCPTSTKDELIILKRSFEEGRNHYKKKSHLFFLVVMMTIIPFLQI